MGHLKVLHVVAAMDPQMGGVCKAVQMMIAGLDKNCCLNQTVSLDTFDAPYLASYSFQIHALGSGKTAWQYNRGLLGWLQLNLCNYDVVIIHGLWLYTSYAVRKAARVLLSRNEKIPRVFVMPHGMLDPYFQKTSGRKLKAIRNWLFWKFIESKVIRNSDGLLFTCEMEKILARKTFTPYEPKKESVVGLGVDAQPDYKEAMTDAFQKKFGLKVPKNYLLYLGRVNEKKGIDLLVKAYLNLREAQFKLPALVIAGPGLETLYGQQIERLASRSSDIFVVGMLDGDAKWGAFYDCQAFVLPSHQENFGIAVVEALGCGKPVLISNQVNIWKEIEDGKAGIVMENSLTGTIELLKRWVSLTKGEKKVMSQNAKKVFDSTFNINKSTERLLEAIA
ncbi:glycosyltransferase [Segetibacter aerophilus]|uniref:Glycosyl transferase n=1 Tax=Segetibacter aerophilus TaxID=670293 RepID=A0A512BEQ1_9BACT|nr:glycosyltransferase [Segetibacter aerophilus]GEO10450.1 glycosyl transferase [Segetibacter aerophilus]